MNALYLKDVAPAEARAMVEAHAVVHRGRVETLCYVTAAATVWAITGVDQIPPFAEIAWTGAGTGPAGADRVVAYGFFDEDEGFFEMEHMVVALSAGIVIDSHWAERRGLTLRVGAPPEPVGNGEVARFFCLNPRSRASS